MATIKNEVNESEEMTTVENNAIKIKNYIVEESAVNLYKTICEFDHRKEIVENIATHTSVSCRI